jgi:hypothetical protein
MPLKLVPVMIPPNMSKKDAEASLIAMEDLQYTNIIRFYCIRAVPE